MKKAEAMRYEKVIRSEIRLAFPVRLRVSEYLVNELAIGNPALLVVHF